MSLFNPVASGIFAVRNADKGVEGDVGRYAVSGAQATSLVAEIAKLDKVVSAVSSKVNPLITFSGAIKVARADDKAEAAISETGAISGMFAGEALFKSNYADKIKVPGKLGVLLKGIAFVGTSIAGYTGGGYLSDNMAERVSANLSYAA